MTDLYAPVVARLASGLQVLTVERPATKTFAASLVVRAVAIMILPGFLASRMPSSTLASLVLI